MLISHFYAILGWLGWAVTLYEKIQMVLYLAQRGSRKVHQQAVSCRGGKSFSKKTPFCYRSGTIFALFYSCST